MLQDAFDKRMKREAEAILEGCLEEENHLWHLNDIGSEKVRALNPNTDGRPVARAHNFGILHSCPQIGRASRVSDLIDLTLAFSMGRRRTR